MSGRDHTPQFKHLAVKKLLARGKRSVHAVLAELGVHRSQLYDWKNKGFGLGPQVETPPKGRRPGIPDVVQRDVDPPNERTGYATPPRETAELSQLRQRRDQLKEEAAALRKTIVLLDRRG